jgi:hypothetical protein
VQDDATASSDDFADFGFVDMSKLKSRIFSMFGGGSKGEEEGTGAGAGASGGGEAGAGAGEDRVSHRDAVTPELVAHLQRIAGAEEA